MATFDWKLQCWNLWLKIATIIAEPVNQIGWQALQWWQRFSVWAAASQSRPRRIARWAGPTAAKIQLSGSWWFCSLWFGGPKLQPHFFCTDRRSYRKVWSLWEGSDQRDQSCSHIFCINYAGNSGCNFGLGDDSQADAESDNMALWVGEKIILKQMCFLEAASRSSFRRSYDLRKLLLEAASADHICFYRNRTELWAEADARSICHSSEAQRCFYRGTVPVSLLGNALEVSGVDQYTYGSVLALLCCKVMGGSPLQNLQAVRADIKVFYRENGTKVQYRYLNKLTMFLRQNGTPKLRGKAGEIRHLAPALLHVWMKYMSPNLEVHIQIKLLLKFSVEMEQLITDCREDISFPPAEATRFAKACETHANLTCCVGESFCWRRNWFVHADFQVPHAPAHLPPCALYQPPASNLVYYWLLFFMATINNRILDPTTCHTHSLVGFSHLQSLLQSGMVFQWRRYAETCATTCQSIG